MIKDSSFEAIKTMLRTEYGTDIFITDEPMSQTVPFFPAVAIVASNNGIRRTTSTLDKIENSISVNITVDIYCNDVDSKDEQALEIMEKIYDAFTKLHYFCDFEGKINNLLDSSISRRNARFSRNELTKNN